MSTEPPEPGCRILPFTPKPQPVATNAMEACYLSYCRQERQEEPARVQRRILAFRRPEERLQDVSLESLRFRWEQPEGYTAGSPVECLADSDGRGLALRCSRRGLRWSYHSQWRG